MTKRVHIPYSFKVRVLDQHQKGELKGPVFYRNRRVSMAQIQRWAKALSQPTPYVDNMLQKQARMKALTITKNAQALIDPKPKARPDLAEIFSNGQARTAIPSRRHDDSQMELVKLKAQIYDLQQQLKTEHQKRDNGSSPSLSH